MPAQRLNFKTIKAQADFSSVLASYNISLVKDGQREHQYRSQCPFHDDENPSLKINTERNIFYCYPCGVHGNVLEFVMKMDECDMILPQ